MTAILDQAIELERLLLSHSVTIFGYERRADLAIVRFVLNERKLRLIVAMPDYGDEKYRLTPSRAQIRSESARQGLYWADVRARWRAMKNLIAAKLDGIEAGITTFEDEFAQFADAEGLLTAGEGE